MKRFTAVLVLSLVLAALPSAAERYQVRRVDVGVSPQAILSVPGGAVVAVTGENAVALVGGSPLRQLDRVELGGEPMALSYDPTGGRIFVTYPGGGIENPSLPGGIVVLRLDGEQLELDQEAPLQAWGPYTSIYDPRTDALYVADIILRDQHGANPPDPIHRVPAASLQASFELEAELVWNMQLDPMTGKLYMPSFSEGILSVLDTSTGEVVLHARPWTLYDLELSHEHERLYLISGLGRLEALDLVSGDWLDPAVTAAQPVDLAVQNGGVYLGFWGPGLTIHDALTLEHAANVHFPWQTETLIGAPEQQRLFAKGRLSGMLAVLDTSTNLVVDHLRVGKNPVGVAYDASSRTLWVSLNGEGSVAALTPQTSSGQSTLTALPDLIPADGLSTSRITVIPRDDNGVQLGPGHSVVIQTTAGLLLGSVADNGDGTYTQRLQSTRRSETAIVSAEVNGTQVKTRPHVVFGLAGFPQVRTSEPDWGYTGVSTLVTVQGANLGMGSAPAAAGGSTRVLFDRTEAIAVMQVLPDEIVCLAPPHAAGVVDITVEHIYVDEPPRSGTLRGGFTYWDTTASSLVAWNRAPGQVALEWHSPPGADARLEASSSPDFSAGLASVAVQGSSLVGPPEPPPTGPITYYRVRFDR